MHTYADDTELYASFNADSRAGRSAALSAMQNCIADVRKWMLQDRLRLNDDKTEFIIIGTRQKLAKVNIYPMQVGESSIAQTSRVKTLGCCSMDNLRWIASVKPHFFTYTTSEG